MLASTRSRRRLDSGGEATAIIGALLDVAAPVVAAAGQDLVLGVAIPGPFDYADGVGRYEGVAKFESLSGVDVGAALSAGLGGPPTRIAFLNDADAFVLGEWTWGAAAGHRRVAGITLGTGVGSGFADSGRIVTDDPRLPPNGSVYLLMIDGQPLEETISRRAILRRTRDSLPDLPADADVLDVARLARTDARARRVFDEALSALGTALAPWLVRFGASVLVVGGSMSGSWDLIQPPLVEGLRGEEPSLAGLLVRRAGHAEDATLIGAAVHAARRGGLEARVEGLR